MINKRTFLKSIDCDTAGWIEHNNSKKPLTIDEELRIFQGNQVGTLARTHYSKGQLVSGSTIQSAIAYTQQLINTHKNIILFEGAFEHNGFVARPDILVKTGEDYQLIEVKSSTPKKLNTAEGKPYLDDIAYTFWIVSSTGINITNAQLWFLNKSYRMGDNPLNLFQKDDCTEQAYDQAQEYTILGPGKKSVIINASIQPAGVLQATCKGCEHNHSCFPNFDQFTLFQIPKMTKKKIQDYIDQGITSASLIPSDKIPDAGLNAYTCLVNGQPLCQKQPVKDAIAQWEYPVGYFDFETINPALPIIADCEPYAQIPFQYSLHIAQTAQQDKTTYQHKEFLANPDHFEPEVLNLAQQMAADLKDCKTIVAYHMSFEQARTKWLAEWVNQKGEPQLANQLMAIRERFVDLEPLIKDHFYDLSFKGSYSIKKVLPVIAPGLTYQGMNVSNGADAAGVFLNKLLCREQELVKKGYTIPSSADLLAYCKQDTWAMVEIVDYFI